MIYLIIILTIIALDQFTKHIIENKLNVYETKEIIKNKLYLKRVNNKGAFYGLLEKKPKFLLFFSFVVMVPIIMIFIKAVKEKDNILKLIISLVLGGALGNIIDRVRKGSVTDFIFIKFENAPIFNVSDFFLFLSFIIAIFKYLYKGK